LWLPLAVCRTVDFEIVRDGRVGPEFDFRRRGRFYEDFLQTFVFGRLGCSAVDRLLKKFLRCITAALYYSFSTVSIGFFLGKNLYLIINSKEKTFIKEYVINGIDSISSNRYTIIRT